MEPTHSPMVQEERTPESQPQATKIEPRSSPSPSSSPALPSSPDKEKLENQPSLPCSVAFLPPLHSGSPSASPEPKEDTPQGAMNHFYFDDQGDSSTLDFNQRRCRSLVNGLRIDGNMQSYKVHEGGKSHFQCPVDKCKKVFTQSGNLKSHLRSHTGDHPFKCIVPKCTERFTAMNSVRRHFKRYHANLGSLESFEESLRRGAAAASNLTQQEIGSDFFDLSTRKRGRKKKEEAALVHKIYSADQPSVPSIPEGPFERKSDQPRPLQPAPQFLPLHSSSQPQSPNQPRNMGNLQALLSAIQVSSCELPSKPQAPTQAILPSSSPLASVNQLQSSGPNPIQYAMAYPAFFPAFHTPFQAPPYQFNGNQYPPNSIAWPMPLPTLPSLPSQFPFHHGFPLIPQNQPIAPSKPIQGQVFQEIASDFKQTPKEFSKEATEPKSN